MTTERAKEILYEEWQGFLENNLDYGGISDAYKMAFKALDQMSVIDTIKAEIKEYKENYDKTEGWSYYHAGKIEGLNDALSIINRYIGGIEC